MVAYLTSGSDATTRYSTGVVRRPDGSVEEVVVYVTGGGWCGSGGCSLFVLQPRDSTYRVIGDIPIVWPPICAVRSNSKGLRDLVVWVHGGGIIPGYRVVLGFNGRRYPGDATGPAAHRLKGNPPADTLIAGSEGQLLFP